MQAGSTIKSTYAGWPIATARLMGLTAKLQMNLAMPLNIKARDEGSSIAKRPRRISQKNKVWNLPS
jgi:hypothetical protein